MNVISYFFVQILQKNVVVSMDIISMDMAETENVGGGGRRDVDNDNLPKRNNNSLYDGRNTGSQQQRSAYTWFPYEHSEPEYKCKLNCFSRDTREYYQTGENVIDGTTCSYDNPSDVCIQGNCIKLGCDKVSSFYVFYFYIQKLLPKIL
jgi:hypothetical protein